MTIAHKAGARLGYCLRLGKIPCRRFATPGMTGAWGIPTSKSCRQSRGSGNLARRGNGVPAGYIAIMRITAFFRNGLRDGTLCATFASLFSGTQRTSFEWLPIAMSAGLFHQFEPIRSEVFAVGAQMFCRAGELL